MTESFATGGTTAPLFLENHAFTMPLSDSEKMASILHTSPWREDATLLNFCKTRLISKVNPQEMDVSMSQSHEKDGSVSRRRFLRQASLLPVRASGVYQLLSRHGLMGLALASSGSVACSESQITGPTETRSDAPSQGQGSLKGKNGESLDEERDGGDESAGDGPSGQDLSASEDQNNQGGASAFDGTTDAAASSKIVSKASGARPNAGFFSRGAPALTQAQIESGVAIEATCEGTNHKLVITPEHLAQLAEGRPVQIRSETKTHFGNPTVHNHTVTYTPILA